MQIRRASEWFVWVPVVAIVFSIAATLPAANADKPDSGDKGTTVKPITEPVNLLKNPGFEETEKRADGRLFAKGWNLHQYSADLDVSLDQESSHDGKNSLRISVNVPREKLGAAVQQTVKGIKPGNAYKLSGWVKTKDLKKGGAPGAVCIQLSFMNDKDQREKLYTAYSGNTDTWQEISCTGKAPDAAISVQVTCIWGDGNSDGIMWFDDLNLLEMQ